MSKHHRLLNKGRHVDKQLDFDYVDCELASWPKLPPWRSPDQYAEELQCLAASLWLCCDASTHYNHVLPPMAQACGMMCRRSDPPVLIPLKINPRGFSSKVVTVLVDRRRTVEQLEEWLVDEKGIPSEKLRTIYKGRPMNRNRYPAFKHFPEHYTTLEEVLRPSAESSDALTTDDGRPVLCDQIEIFLVLILGRGG